jgi:hypothetical protein
MLPPYGVAPPDHPLVGLPVLADLYFHLLLDCGECIVSYLMPRSTEFFVSMLFSTRYNSV